MKLGDARGVIDRCTPQVLKQFRAWARGQTEFSSCFVAARWQHGGCWVSQCEPLVNHLWTTCELHLTHMTLIHIDPYWSYWSCVSLYHFTYLYIILYNFTIFYITSCDLRWSLCATKYWCCVQPMLRPFYRKDLAQSCPYLACWFWLAWQAFFRRGLAQQALAEKQMPEIWHVFSRKKHILIGWLGWWFGRALSSEQNVLSFLLICLRKQSKRNCRQKVPTKMRSSKWYSSRFSVQKHKWKWLYKEETQASHQNSRINMQCWREVEVPAARISLKISPFYSSSRCTFSFSPFLLFLLFLFPPF